MSKPAKFASLVLLVGHTGVAVAGPDDPCNPPPRIEVATRYEGWNAGSMDQFGANLPEGAAQASYRFEYRSENRYKNGQARFCVRSTYASSPPSPADYGGGQENCTIVTASGDQIALMPPMFPNGTPVYFKQSASDMKRQRELFGGSPMNAAPANVPARTPATLSRTDQTRVIDGRQAALYVGSSADGNTRFEKWITTDIDDAALIRRAEDCLSHRIDPSGGEPASSDVPGIAVETRTFFHDQQTSEVRLISISRKPIGDEDFRVPPTTRACKTRPGMPRRPPARPSPRFPGCWTCLACRCSADRQPRGGGVSSRLGLAAVGNRRQAKAGVEVGRTERRR
ncbi:exported hypothetical protein [Thiocapsa sp. KS1]|nr:exported hypothetical protein [Thiocapsa sp. KS1]